LTKGSPARDDSGSPEEGLHRLEQTQTVVVGDTVSVTVARAVYPLDAVYGASYVFIDRCFVLLDAPDGEHVRIHLRGREPLGHKELDALAGELGNELLTQVWRQRTVEQNRPLVEAVVGRAISGAAGPAGLDDLVLGQDADVFDDPLGIAVPWEEKYGASGKSGEPPAGS
jgi:His-Xaa-Ser system protein HxsD